MTFSLALSLIIAPDLLSFFMNPETTNLWLSLNSDSQFASIDMCKPFALS